jgi:serine/threonine protein phosphatase PrpC
LRYGSATDKGLIRSNNEDYLKVYTSNGEFPVVFIIADGMGGHRKGELASTIAVEYSYDQISELLTNESSVEDVSRILVDTIEKANVKVYLGSLEDPENKGMGTTLTIAAVHNDTLIVAHVGDCRTYLLRKNSLMRITVDHTLVQEMVDLGKITPTQSMKHPKRHVLTRALGVPDYMMADIYTVLLEKNDKILLSSDGLHGFVNEEIIKAVLKREKNPAGAASRLIEYANSVGGEDNVTVIAGYY